MKPIVCLLAILVVALRLPAQTNAPVRLALISETGEGSTAADVLTAELSNRQNLQLLERNEIEKVYREQALSAGNRDYLKLGQLLCADGLLLLDVVRTTRSTNLMARLIAVKPGVILTDGSFDWPLKDTAQWAESVSSYLNLLLPKLSVQAKDAIPISVVNLRSAVASAGGAETERQLKLLTIQRLSQEKDLFVLERQKMQLLSEEKALKTDDSAFWNGGYLLEGVVDQNGYSQDRITLNARLTPSKGGTPLTFDVSGSRTNLGEVINHLAAKVIESLDVKSSVPEWNSADEAAQYFAEAQWALRWGSYAEAQAAAESAWALGRRDVASAMLRVRAYMVSPDSGKAVIYYPPKERPDVQTIDFALRALEIYSDSSRNLPPDDPQVDSEWYHLGLENLTVASRVLQVFNWSPDFYQPVGVKLAELRAAARSAAEWISRSPSVQASYFVGNQVVPYDDLYHFEEKPSIFSVKLDCGCLWQDSPADCLELYRNLMSSPVFCYLHDRLWFRDNNHRSALQMLPPRLVAWSEPDQEKIPAVWDDYMRELNGSTNLLLQLEAKAIRLADSTNETVMAATFTNFFSMVFSNREALVANPVDVLYLEWRIGDLVESMGGDIATQTKESLRQLYYSDYRPKVAAMHQEYQRKTVAARQTALAFEQQKQYLANFTSYDFAAFQQTFASRDFTKIQATELLPLIAAYKSNLIAQASTAPEKFKAQANAQWIAVSLEKGVNEILNPPVPTPAPAKSEIPRPPVVAKIIVASSASNRAPEMVTNVITVRKFMKVPLESLYALEGDEQVENSSAKITAHHWQEGRLLLDLQFDIEIVLPDRKGGYRNFRQESGPAIAIFDPATAHWEIMRCPEVNFETQSRFYHRTALFRGKLFNGDGGQIRKYDPAGRQWEVLPVSDGVNYELFNVNDHLYAANGNMICEIIDDGKSTRILASNRRNPPVSRLDPEELGTPTLFEGPDHALRVCTKSKIFTWTGDDWREDGAAPPFSLQPGIFADGVLFRQSEGGYSKPDCLTFLATATNSTELWLWQKVQPPNQVIFNSSSTAFRNKVPDPQPLWKMPANLALPNLPAAPSESSLYLLVDHSEVQDIVNDQQHVITGKKILPKGGYHAALLCFSRGLPSPQKVLFKFDAPEGCPPVTGIDPISRQAFPGAPPVWLLFTTNYLILGLDSPQPFLPDGMESIRIGRETGVWLVPLHQITEEVTGQARTQLEQITKSAAAAEQARQNFKARIDLNHNGTIDPDEKESALDDPAFIESELDMIDTNHNGRLDAAELVYFDANHNRTLEPKEQAGFDIAQHLLAERLLRKFDANGDGMLDRSEFNDLLQSFPDANRQLMPGFAFQFPDDNHDVKIDLAELETFMKQQLRKELRPRGARGAAHFSQMIVEPGKRPDASQSFKVYVELYWQNPGGTTNQPPDHKPN